MKTVTFRVLDGVDKGRVYRDLSTPVTIGREEGNALRLNDERVSRFHAKIQVDQEDIILTDLESTNGTRVNGHPIQIRRLRAGDQVSLGRSLLLFGSHEEIQARLAALQASVLLQSTNAPGSRTAGSALAEDFVLNEGMAEAVRDWLPSPRELPPLPEKLTPAQAARFAEILDFLHRVMSSSTEHIQANEDNAYVRIPFQEWQKLQYVQLFLARYLRSVGDPDAPVGE